MRYRFTRTAMLFACLILVGCSQPAESVAEESRVPQQDPRTRSEVPLVRPINLAHAGELVDIEFDLPPPNRNASGGLMIGMRIARKDIKSGGDLAHRLIKAHIQSRVMLSRVEPGKQEYVQLFRMRPDVREELLVPESGEVVDLTNTSVETTALEQSGLVDPDTYYKVLMFASARGLAPGRYRLNILIDSDQAEFEGEDIDLLVAYFKKAK